MNRVEVYTKASTLRLLLVGLFIGLSISLAAQQSDSLKLSSSPLVDSLRGQDTLSPPQSLGFMWRALQDSIAVFQTDWESPYLFYHPYTYVDTLNHNSGLYSPFRQLGQPYVHLGIVGSAAQPQLFTPTMGQAFDVGIHAFDAFLWHINRFKIIKSKNPYTKLGYVMGGKKENHLKVQHAQSFLHQTLGFQLDFILHNDIGDYQRQHSDVKDFKIGMHYHTPSNRYRALAYYYNSRLNLQENGGVVNINNFEAEQIKSKDIVPVNLLQAESRVRRGGVAVQQHFYLSKALKSIPQIADTTQQDSSAFTSSKGSRKPVSHWGQLSHIFYYQRDKYSYEDRDQNSALYLGIPYYPTVDSSAFFDSITFSKIHNEIRYGNGDVQDVEAHPKVFNYYVGWRMEQYAYRQAQQKTNMAANAATAALYLYVSQYLNLGVQAHYYIADAMGGNYLLNSYLNISWTKLQAHFAFALSRDNAPWMMQSFVSSRFAWQQSLKPVDVQKISGQLQLFNTKLRLDISNINNYCYYDETFQPQQYSGALQHILLRVDNTFTWRHWGSDISAAYQLSSQTNILRVPDFWGGFKLYYTNRLFKQKLQLEVGVENAWHTVYFADAWMPALRAFCLQDKQSIGGYLLSDIYLNIKVGKARLFLHYDHFNAHFARDNYFSAPRYPGEGASFRFGVHWILFD